MYFISALLILLLSNSNVNFFYGDGKIDVEGDWKFVHAEKVENTSFLNQFPNPQPVVDEIPLLQPPYKGADFRFEKDSMYELNYPISMNDRLKFSIDSGYLVTYRGHHIIHRYPIEKKNDTLCIYKFHDGQTYIKESYVKTTLNDSMMNILITQGVNYAELAGTWSLIREDGIDDGSMYILKFPFKIPDSLTISREEFIQATKNNLIYYMSTNGKKRDYLLSYQWGYLQLTPGKWYKGEDPWIHFGINKAN